MIQAPKQKSPRYVQVYQMLKKKIEEGDYQPGQRLPSKRVLAEVCSCSLNTIENALSLLEEEGYIRMEQRRGAFVESLPETAGSTEFTLHLLEDEAGAGKIPPKDALFPASLWAQTIRQVLSEDPQAVLIRSPNKGSSRLRNAIARFLVQTRGMKVQPEQIIIGSGTTSLYETLIRMFSGSMSVALEKPGYYLIEKLYRERARFRSILCPCGKMAWICRLCRTARRSFSMSLPIPAIPPRSALRWREERTIWTGSPSGTGI